MAQDFVPADEARSLQQRKQRSAFESSVSDIVSIAGRYPGSSPDAGIPGFWETVAQEKDLPSTVPLQRWDVDEYYSPEGKGRQLSMYVRQAAFVENVDHFDASLFRCAVHIAVPFLSTTPTVLLVSCAMAAPPEVIV